MFDDENAAAGRTVLFWSILIGLIVLGFTYIHVWLQPTWLGYERKAFVESHQYVEARKEEILTNIQQYDLLTTEIAKYEQDAEKNVKIISGLKVQQHSLKNKIQLSLAKIPREAWPPGSERFSK